MTIDVDPLYIAARKVLLDALEALKAHRENIVVAGAQAIYIRIGGADIAIAPYTTDADLALDPQGLRDEPLLEVALRNAGFDLLPHEGPIQPGMWGIAVTVDGRTVDVPVDLLIPEAFATTTGRRSGGPSPHDKMSARRVSGLEAVLVDNDIMEIGALEEDDVRSFAARVAGASGLLVAKVHKISDRLATGKRQRIDEKDAADVYRLMQGTSADLCAEKLAELLKHPKAGDATRMGIAYLEEFFGAPGREGISMAIEALRAAVPESRIRGVCGAFMEIIRRGTSSVR